MDIYELGLMQVKVGDDAHVDISMTLTSPACPVAREPAQRGGAEGGPDAWYLGLHGGDHLRAAWDRTMMSEATTRTGLHDGGRTHHQQGRHIRISPRTWKQLYPAGERVVFDLKPLLWQEIALKEEDDLHTFSRTRLVAVCRKARERALQRRCHRTHLGLHAGGDPPETARGVHHTG